MRVFVDIKCASEGDAHRIVQAIQHEFNEVTSLHSVPTAPRQHFKMAGITFRVNWGK